MQTGISIREFGRRDGCSDTLVRKAVKLGKLRAFEDGTLDPALVGSAWRKQNRAGANSANLAANPANPVRASVTIDEAADAEAEIYAEEAESFLDQVLAGRFADIARAERIKENALAAKHLLAARKEAGSLVEIETAKLVLFETQRAQRDAWMNFPAKIGPLLAAELGIEADKVVEALTAHVHEQLDDLGEPDPEFTDRSEA